MRVEVTRGDITKFAGRLEARVRELLAAGTWPHGWTGTEPTGDVWLDAHFADGSVQPLLGIFEPGSR